MGLTMTDEQEALARERVCGNGNYTMESVAASVSLSDILAELDATRAKLAEAEDLRAKAAAANSQRGAELERMAKRLAEVEARCADVERERDEARTLAARRNEIAAEWMREHAKLRLALAASQAECARLRHALWEASQCYLGGGCPKCLRSIGDYEPHDDGCFIGAALASAPGSTDALREVVAAALAVQREISTQQYGVALSEGSISAIVSRILGERSDDAQQGRVERAKEGGDA